MNSLKIIIILIITLMINCNTQNSYKQFINKYQNEDFSKYKNIEIFYRGSDNQGNIVIYGYFICNINDSLKSKYFLISLDKLNNNIKKIQCPLGDNEENIDSLKLSHLAQSFIAYNIDMLKVDKNENVYLGLKSNERADLIRVSDKKTIPEIFKNWKKIKGNWYKRK